MWAPLIRKEDDWQSVALCPRERGQMAEGAEWMWGRLHWEALPVLIPACNLASKEEDWKPKPGGDWQADSAVPGLARGYRPHGYQYYYIYAEKTPPLSWQERVTRGK